MQKKSEVFENLKLFAARLHGETGKRVRTLRTDNGGEFVSMEMEDWMVEQGIHHQTSIPHTPQQNGAAERENRTLMEATRSILHQKGLPKELWAEAVSSATYTINRSLPQSAARTPYELWYGKKPNVSHLRVFGSPAFAHIPDANRRKLDAKSLECIMVGYCTSQKGYRLWDPATRRVIVSRDVSFHEQADENDPEHPAHSAQSPESTHKAPVPPAGLEPSQNQQAQQVEPPARRSSTRGRIPIRNWPSLYVMGKICKVPRSYAEALASPESLLWQAAMEEELQSLLANETWILVDRPVNRLVIQCLWTYKLKEELTGDQARYKTRLVAKGFKQRQGIDFNETYSPVVRYDSLRTVLSIAAARDLDIIQLDIKTAFLYGELEEEIYLEQPEGYTVPGSESKVCLLKKCIYGLKQSSRIWNQRFDSFLTQFGLEPSEADPCVYFYEKNGDILIVAIWVDDGLVCGSSMEMIQQVLDHLKSNFEMTSRPADHFVGLQISRNREERLLKVSQPQHISAILKKFNMDSSSTRIIPFDPNGRLSKQMAPTTEEEKEEMQQVPYREAVGSLMYVTTTFRPDIAYAVSQVAQFCENPGRPHWTAVKRIMAYLKGTLNHGIVFGKKEEEEALQLYGYTDADYAGDLDHRRSTTGYIYKLNGGPVAWCSRRQQCTAMSTTEAEYVAALSA